MKTGAIIPPHRGCRGLGIRTLLVLMLAPLLGSGAAVEIPHGGILDHGDAATPGSLAWHFMAGKEGDRYALASSAVYETTRPLRLPPGTTLTVAPEVSATVRATGGESAAVYDVALLRLGSQARLQGREGEAASLIIDANRTAGVGLDAYGTTGVTVQDVTVHDTLNRYPAGDRALRMQHLINANMTSRMTIRRCHLFNAGFPALDFENYESVARGISLNWSTDGLVEDCHVRGTLGGSIAIADSLRIKLLGNRLELSGRCSADYGKSYSEDSIIGYHSRLTRGLDKQVVMARNVITGWGNHGIHVSGLGFVVTGNTITDGVAGYAFYLGDWRSPKECSGRSTITDNVFGPSKATDKTVRIGPHLKNTIILERNAGQEGATIWEEECPAPPEEG